MAKDDSVEVGAGELYFSGFDVEISFGSKAVGEAAGKESLEEAFVVMDDAGSFWFEMGEKLFFFGVDSFEVAEEF